MGVLKNDWSLLLGEEFKQDYYLRLRKFLISEYRSKTIYPDMYDIFNAFHYTAFAATKVVIIGQDPYHGPGQAHGLSFSVKPGVTPPPSLRNIFQELEDDLGYPAPDHGCLISWAQEGVLLINSVLTVRQGQANSHRGIGWENFTNKAISLISEKKEAVVFILWGRNAQEKESLIDTSRHLIIASSHPSPLSARRGFFGSKPFSRSNEFLSERGLEPVNWQLPPLL